VSCDPRRPCDAHEAGLGLVPPPPGLTRLLRRVGDFDAFFADVVARTEQTRPVAGGPPLGRDWDVEGDPRARTLARLWAYVAEGVAAYAELTAGEAYLPTAADWTDLRRLSALVGYRPRPRVAATGLVRFDTDKGTAPLVPAGTKVQAPGTETRDAQTYEVVADTQLRADWAAFTATPVPLPMAEPDGREMRFLGDPDFKPGDRVLFVYEEGSTAFFSLDWGIFWTGLIGLWGWLAPTSTQKPRGVAVVGGRTAELGTTVVSFDRDLKPLLPAATRPYAAYRVVARAGSARRLTKVVRIPTTGAAQAIAADYGVTLSASYTSASTGSSIVLDAALDDVSVGQQVAVVNWASDLCDVVAVTAHHLVEWDAAPGTTTRVSKLSFAGSVGTLGGSGPVTAYVLDRRQVAQHYTFPATVTGSPPRLRLYPAPVNDEAPPKVAVRVGDAWDVFDAAKSATQESPPPAGDGRPAPRGLIVDLDRTPAGSVDRVPASGNLVAVRHGTTTNGVAGSGDGLRTDQEMTLAKAPVTYDTAPDGSVVPSLLLRVAGVEQVERETLYGAGDDDVFAVRLAEDGAVTVRFGRALPSGRNNVTATYRVGGGTAGEVPSGAIDALAGSVRGVKGVEGVGPTTGGADQDDAGRLRALAPTRARAFGRVVSRGDLVDVSLAYSGVSHAAAWLGAGPPGCGCGASGVHLAFLRTGTAGPRAPLAGEVTSLRDYLDARRDTDTPLCVCAGVATSVAVTATLAVDPRRETAAVVAAAQREVAATASPLVAVERALGQPLDRSDVLLVLHAATGVVGVPTLVIAGVPAADPLGRRPAARYELLLPAVTLTGVPA
jgi:hypothetical protein